MYIYVCIFIYCVYIYICSLYNVWYLCIVFCIHIYGMVSLRVSHSWWYVPAHSVGSWRYSPTPNHPPHLTLNPTHHLTPPTPPTQTCRSKPSCRWYQMLETHGNTVKKSLPSPFVPFLYFGEGISTSWMNCWIARDTCGTLWANYLIGFSLS